MQPMGVLALLDEECLFPKGGDKSYLEKLNKNHADKSPNFVKAHKSRQQNAEFEIAHYAGTVSWLSLETISLFYLTLLSFLLPYLFLSRFLSLLKVCYTVTGWLDKNKDPLNESVVDLLKKSTDPFIASLWSDYSVETERGRGKKGSQFVTVAQIHKQSLHHLLTTLRKYIYINHGIMRETLLTRTLASRASEPARDHYVYTLYTPNLRF